MVLSVSVIIIFSSCSILLVHIYSPYNDGVQVIEVIFSLDWMAITWWTSLKLDVVIHCNWTIAVLWTFYLNAYVYDRKMKYPLIVCIVKGLFFVGYQISCFLWVGQTNEIWFPMKRRFPLVCILKTSNYEFKNPWKLVFLPLSTKIGIHELKYFHCT